jgi:stage II sporulation protein P
LHNPNGYTADLQSALCAPLSWQLANGQPAVLILHSHASEAFSNCAGWRSENTAYNMVSIGDRVGALLEKAGIQVIHDRSLHDSPSYDAAYGNSRTSIESYLTQYPSIRLVLDLHRDAGEDGNGNQVGYTTDYNGQDAATMMLVVSAYDYGGNAAWQRNLSFATKLQLQLEQLSPGICRPLVLRSYHYNQDICPTGLLIEMGFAGNEQEEALRSAEALAEAIIALQNGSEVITAVSAE